MSRRRGRGGGRREEVLDACYRARSREAIARAYEVRGRWLVGHPDDMEVLDLGEMVSKIDAALKLIEAGLAEVEPAARA